MAKSQFIPISTKSGDTGTSGLIDGTRLSKSSEHFAALGALDELNAWLGFALVVFPVSDAPRRTLLRSIQKDIYSVSALIARAPKTRTTFSKANVEQIEADSNALQTVLHDQWTQAFLYPGGCEAAARLDVARTVCRRAEREVWCLHEQEPQELIVLSYLNRLSDYLYVLRCYVNQLEGYVETEFSVSK